MKSKVLYFYLLFFLFIEFSVSAQSFDDGIEPPPAPIDGSIGVLMAVAVLFSVYFFYIRKCKPSKKILLIPVVATITLLCSDSVFAQVKNNGILHIGTNATFFVKSGDVYFGPSSETTTSVSSVYSDLDGKFMLGPSAAFSVIQNATKYIKGYAGTFNTNSTILAIGAGSVYAPVKVTATSNTNGVRASYFNSSPLAVYSGGLDLSVSQVANTEYWIVKGENAILSLSWRASSNLSALVFPDVTIVGYKDGKWEAIPSAIDATSVFGNTSVLSGSGSVTSTAPVNLNDYSAFAIGEKGVTCSELIASSGNIKTWNGTFWSPSVPTLADPVIINGSYAAGSFSCNSIVLNADVILSGTETLEIVNGAAGSGKVIMSSESSLVQRNENAIAPLIQLTKTTRPMKRFDYVYWGQPIAGNAFGQLANATASTATLSGAFDLMYKFVSGITGPSGGWQPLATTSPGQGFITRVKEQSPYVNTTSTDVINLTFNGIANNGNISVPIANVVGSTTSSRNNNLLANPYPSAIDADKFLTQNNDILDGVIYLWRANTTNPTGNTNYAISDYVAYTKAGSTAYNGTSSTPVFNGKIASGQGFKVKALSAGTALFTNCMRVVGNNSQFFRTSNTTPANTVVDRFKVNIQNESGIANQILVAYLPETTLGYDTMYDAELYSVNSLQLYSVLDNSDKKLAINARPVFTETDQVQLGIKKTDSQVSNYAIQVVDKEGVFATNAVTVYLHDTATNTYHNFNNGNYNFSLADLENNNRFKIVYQSTLSKENFTTNNIHAFVNNDVLNLKSNVNIENINVFDVSGRLIISYENDMPSSLMTVPFNHASGVYILKTKLSNGQLQTQKLLKN